MLEVIFYGVILERVEQSELFAGFDMVQTK